ncbi:MAG: hypothetical protein KGL95_07300, partial [Patescibacteria group bacterium]|nr:hypothetical protein [Patescibacteria group bacterium]
PSKKLFMRMAWMLQELFLSKKILLETDHKPSFCRFLGSFELIFDFLSGGHIRKLIKQLFFCKIV